MFNVMYAWQLRACVRNRWTICTGLLCGVCNQTFECRLYQTVVAAMIISRRTFWHMHRIISDNNNYVKIRCTLLLCFCFKFISLFLGSAIRWLLPFRWLFDVVVVVYSFAANYWWLWGRYDTCVCIIFFIAICWL